MKTARKIELLAPAKNCETGKAAIDHGADAVYIGAPAFSARASAGNSLESIQELVDYAHLFHARVYVALNTLIKDSELAEVELLIRDIFRTGVDALIIQDWGILEMNLPPIALHASTQMNNRTAEKVRFLESEGFSQVVLARELSLSQIKEIAEQTSVPLEVFVHGALCTSYSGQCYISQAFSGRSANRGECAQYCRLPYSIIDDSGKSLGINKHFLSLKDLNLSDSLEELLDAGVSSLKIEGRLKDIAYVKNITAYYRGKLDRIMERRPEYVRSSAGTSTPFFLPNPEKSFNRGFTSYFLHGRNREMASPNTPKSLGEPVGNVRDINSRFFTIQGSKPINNGDGLCFLNEKKELQGFRVNKVENGRVFPADMPRLEKGTALFRNQDHIFVRELEHQSAERRISIDLTLSENNFGFSLTVIDETGLSVSVTTAFAKEPAQKPQQDNQRTQLSKLGNTPFQLNNLTIDLSDNWFIPSSLLAELRRQVTQKLETIRRVRHQIPKRGFKTQGLTDFQLPTSYLANVANEKARQFYKKQGIDQVDPAFELSQPGQVAVMISKYCLRYQLGMCSKGKNDAPFTLVTGSNRMSAVFDCERCEMQIRTEK